MRFKILFVVAMLFLFLTSCKDGPTETLEDKPGRRDYEWTQDTLKADAGTIMYLNNIWGSSPTDIWAVGGADESKYEIWHYDGNKWSPGTPKVGLNASYVYGFSSDNVWLANNNKTFWHYDGSSWTKFSEHTYKDDWEVLINCIYGDSPNEVFGCGFATNISTGEFEPIVMNFNGSKWGFYDIPYYNTTLVSLAKQKSTGYLIANGRANSVYNSETLFLIHDHQLEEIRKSNYTMAVNPMRGEVYISDNQKIYKFYNGDLNVVNDFTGTSYAGRLWGRSEIDYFTEHYDGIGHYNGTDLEVIYPTTLRIANAFVFEKDVFFLTIDFDNGNKNIVIHGKLKETEE